MVAKSSVKSRGCQEVKTMTTVAEGEVVGAVAVTTVSERCSEVVGAVDRVIEGRRGHSVAAWRRRTRIAVGRTRSGRRLQEMAEVLSLMSDLRGN